MFRTTLDTPVGTLSLFADDFALYRISFPAGKINFPEAASAPENHLLLNQVKQQLNAYFDGSRRRFDLPLAVEGTAFQQAVWKCMLEIPFGETRTYGEIAAALDNPNKARAVGGAANKNPLPIVIPCHRLIGSSGSLTGFAGGLKVKRFILALEENASKLL